MAKTGFELLGINNVDELGPFKRQSLYSEMPSPNETGGEAFQQSQDEAVGSSAGIGEYLQDSSFWGKDTYDRNGKLAQFGDTRDNGTGVVGFLNNFVDSAQAGALGMGAGFLKYAGDTINSDMMKEWGDAMNERAAYNSIDPKALEGDKAVWWANALGNAAGSSIPTMIAFAGLSALAPTAAVGSTAAGLVAAGNTASKAGKIAQAFSKYKGFSKAAEVADAAATSTAGRGMLSKIVGSTPTSMGQTLAKIQGARYLGNIPEAMSEGGNAMDEFDRMNAERVAKGLPPLSESDRFIAKHGTALGNMAFLTLMDTVETGMENMVMNKAFTNTGKEYLKRMGLTGMEKTPWTDVALRGAFMAGPNALKEGAEEAGQNIISGVATGQGVDWNQTWEEAKMGAAGGLLLGSATGAISSRNDNTRRAKIGDTNFAVQQVGYDDFGNSISNYFVDNEQVSAEKFYEKFNKEVEAEDKVDYKNEAMRKPSEYNFGMDAETMDKFHEAQRGITATKDYQKYVGDMVLQDSGNVDPEGNVIMDDIVGKTNPTPEEADRMIKAWDKIQKEHPDVAGKLSVDEANKVRLNLRKRYANVNAEQADVEKGKEITPQEEITNIKQGTTEWHQAIADADEAESVQNGKEKEFYDSNIAWLNDDNCPVPKAEREALLKDITELDDDQKIQYINAFARNNKYSPRFATKANLEKFRKAVAEHTGQQPVNIPEGTQTAPTEAPTASQPQTEQPQSVPQEAPTQESPQEQPKVETPKVEPQTEQPTETPQEKPAEVKEEPQEAPKEEPKSEPKEEPVEQPKPEEKPVETRKVYEENGKVHAGKFVHDTKTGKVDTGNGFRERFELPNSNLVGYVTYYANMDKYQYYIRKETADEGTVVFEDETQYATLDEARNALANYDGSVGKSSSRIRNNEKRTDKQRENDEFKNKVNYWESQESDNIGLRIVAGDDIEAIARVIDIGDTNLSTLEGMTNERALQTFYNFVSLLRNAGVPIETNPQKLADYLVNEQHCDSAVVEKDGSVTYTKNGKSVTLNGHFGDNGVIYVNGKSFNLDTPFHEHCHLWWKEMFGEAKSANEVTDPKRKALWKRIEELVKQTKIYDEITNEKTGNKELVEIYKKYPLEEAYCRIVGNYSTQLEYNFPKKLKEIKDRNKFRRVAYDFFDQLLKDFGFNGLKSKSQGVEELLNLSIAPVLEKNLDKFEQLEEAKTEKTKAKANHSDDDKKEKEEPKAETKEESKEEPSDAIKEAEERAAGFDAVSTIPEGLSEQETLEEIQALNALSNTERWAKWYNRDKLKGSLPQETVKQYIDLMTSETSVPLSLVQIAANNTSDGFKIKANKTGEAQTVDLSKLAKCLVNARINGVLLENVATKEQFDVIYNSLTEEHPDLIKDISREKFENLFNSYCDNIQLIDNHNKPSDVKGLDSNTNIVENIQDFIKGKNLNDLIGKDNETAYYTYLSDSKVIKTITNDRGEIVSWEPIDLFTGKWKSQAKAVAFYLNALLGKGNDATLNTFEAGAGKTYMSTAMIQEILKVQPHAKILVLAGQDMTLNSWKGAFGPKHIHFVQVNNNPDYKGYVNGNIHLCTYRSMDKIADEEWDYIFADESQNIQSNKSADGEEDYNRNMQMMNWLTATGPHPDASTDTKERKAHKKPKVMYISATPMPYITNIESYKPLYNNDIKGLVRKIMDKIKSSDSLSLQDYIDIQDFQKANPNINVFNTDSLFSSDKSEGTTFEQFIYGIVNGVDIDKLAKATKNKELIAIEEAYKAALKNYESDMKDYEAEVRASTEWSKGRRKYEEWVREEDDREKNHEPNEALRKKKLEEAEAKRKQEYEDKEVKRKQEHEEAEAARKQKYEDDEKSRKQKHEDDEAARKEAYEKAEAKRKKEHDDAEKKRKKEHDDAENKRKEAHYDAEAKKKLKYDNYVKVMKSFGRAPSFPRVAASMTFLGDNRLVEIIKNYDEQFMSASEKEKILKEIEEWKKRLEAEASNPNGANRVYSSNKNIHNKTEYVLLTYEKALATNLQKAGFFVRGEFNKEVNAEIFSRSVPFKGFILNQYIEDYSLLSNSDKLKRNISFYIDGAAIPVDIGTLMRDFSKPVDTKTLESLKPLLSKTEFKGKTWRDVIKALATYGANDIGLEIATPDGIYYRDVFRDLNGRVRKSGNTAKDYFKHLYAVLNHIDGYNNREDKRTSFSRQQVYYNLHAEDVLNYYNHYAATPVEKYVPTPYVAGPEYVKGPDFVPSAPYEPGPAFVPAPPYVKGPDYVPSAPYVAGPAYVYQPFVPKTMPSELLQYEDPDSKPEIGPKPDKPFRGIFSLDNALLYEKAQAVLDYRNNTQNPIKDNEKPLWGLTLRTREKIKELLTDSDKFEEAKQAYNGLKNDKAYKLYRARLNLTNREECSQELYDCLEKGQPIPRHLMPVYMDVLKRAEAYSKTLKDDYGAMYGDASSVSKDAMFKVDRIESGNSKYNVLFKTFVSDTTNGELTLDQVFAASSDESKHSVAPAFKMFTEVLKAMVEIDLMMDRINSGQADDEKYIFISNYTGVLKNNPFLLDAQQIKSLAIKKFLLDNPAIERTLSAEYKELKKDPLFRQTWGNFLYQSLAKNRDVVDIAKRYSANYNKWTLRPDIKAVLDKFDKEFKGKTVTDAIMNLIPQEVRGQAIKIDGSVTTGDIDSEGNTLRDKLVKGFNSGIHETDIYGKSDKKGEKGPLLAKSGDKCRILVGSLGTIREGVSFHDSERTDKNGISPRMMFLLFTPDRPYAIEQVLKRIFRAGTISNSTYHLPIIGISSELTGWTRCLGLGQIMTSISRGEAADYMYLSLLQEITNSIYDSTGKLKDGVDGKTANTIPYDNTKLTGFNELKKRDGKDDEYFVGRSSVIGNKKKHNTRLRKRYVETQKVLQIEKAMNEGDTQKAIDTMLKNNSAHSDQDIDDVTQKGQHYTKGVIQNQFFFTDAEMKEIDKWKDEDINKLKNVLSNLDFIYYNSKKDSKTAHNPIAVLKDGKEVPLTNVEEKVIRIAKDIVQTDIKYINELNEYIPKDQKDIDAIIASESSDEGVSGEKTNYNKFLQLIADSTDGKLTLGKVRGCGVVWSFKQYEKSSPFKLQGPTNEVARVAGKAKAILEIKGKEDNFIVKSKEAFDTMFTPYKPPRHAINAPKVAAPPKIVIESGDKTKLKAILKTLTEAFKKETFYKFNNDWIDKILLTENGETSAVKDLAKHVAQVTEETQKMLDIIKEQSPEDYEEYQAGLEERKNWDGDEADKPAPILDVYYTDDDDNEYEFGSITSAHAREWVDKWLTEAKIGEISKEKRSSLVGLVESEIVSKYIAYEDAQYGISANSIMSSRIKPHHNALRDMLEEMYKSDDGFEIISLKNGLRFHTNTGAIISKTVDDVLTSDNYADKADDFKSKYNVSTDQMKALLRAMNYAYGDRIAREAENELPLIKNTEEVSGRFMVVSATGKNSTFTEKAKKAKELFDTTDLPERIIFYRTGCFKDIDGEWKTWINDVKSGISKEYLSNPNKFKNGVKLKSIYNNPMLFKNCPYLENVTVYIEKTKADEEARVYKGNIYLSENLFKAPSDGVIGFSTNGKPITHIIRNNKLVKNITDEDYKPIHEILGSLALGNDIAARLANEKWDYTTLKRQLPVYKKQLTDLLARLENRPKTANNKALLEYTYKALNDIKRISFIDMTDDVKADMARDKVARSLFHEVQHIIQNNEGFSIGAGPNIIIDLLKNEINYLDTMLRKAPALKLKQYDDDLAFLDDSSVESIAKAVSNLLKTGNVRLTPAQQSKYKDIKNKFSDIAKRYNTNLTFTPKNISTLRNIVSKANTDATREAFSLHNRRKDIKAALDKYEKAKTPTARKALREDIYELLHGEQEARRAGFLANNGDFRSKGGYVFLPFDDGKMLCQKFLKETSKDFASLSKDKQELILEYVDKCFTYVGEGGDESAVNLINILDNVPKSEFAKYERINNSIRNYVNYSKFSYDMLYDLIENGTYYGTTNRELSGNNTSFVLESGTTHTRKMNKYGVPITDRDKVETSDAKYAALTSVGGRSQAVGKKAFKENNPKYLKALEMEKNKYSRDDIFMKTGFYRGNDNKWRTHIADNLDNINLDILKDGEEYRLEDVYGPSQIFEFYPHLKEVKVNAVRQPYGEMGSTNGKTHITLNKRYIDGTDNDRLNMKGTLIHEVQHMIQYAEGFAQGGNSTSIRLFFNNLIKRYISFEAQRYLEEDMREYESRLKTLTAILEREKARNAKPSEIAVTERLIRNLKSHPPKLGDSSSRYDAIAQELSSWRGLTAQMADLGEFINNIDRTIKSGKLNDVELRNASNAYITCMHKMKSLSAELQKKLDQTILPQDKHLIPAAIKKFVKMITENNSFEVYQKLGGEIEARQATLIAELEKAYRNGEKARIFPELWKLNDHDIESAQSYFYEFERRTYEFDFTLSPKINILDIKSIFDSSIISLINNNKVLKSSDLGKELLNSKLETLYDAKTKKPAGRFVVLTHAEVYESENPFIVLDKATNQPVHITNDEKEAIDVAYRGIPKLKEVTRKDIDDAITKTTSDVVIIYEKEVLKGDIGGRSSVSGIRHRDVANRGIIDDDQTGWFTQFYQLLDMKDPKGTLKNEKEMLGGKLGALARAFYISMFDKNHAMHDLDEFVFRMTGMQLLSHDSVYEMTQGAPTKASGVTRVLTLGDKHGMDVINTSLGLKGTEDELHEKGTMEQVLLAFKEVLESDNPMAKEFIKNYGGTVNSAAGKYLAAVILFARNRVWEEGFAQRRIDAMKKGKRIDYTPYKMPEVEINGKKEKMTIADVVEILRDAGWDIKERDGLFFKHYTEDRSGDIFDQGAEFKDGQRVRGKFFDTALGRYQELNKNIQRLLVSSGCINRDLKNALERDMPDYAPMIRDFSSTAAADTHYGRLTSGGSGVGNIKMMLNKIAEEGSYRLIKNPLETTIQAVSVASNRAIRNRVGQKVVASMKEALKQNVEDVKNGKIGPDGKKVELLTEDDLPIVKMPTPPPVAHKFTGADGKIHTKMVPQNAQAQPENCIFTVMFDGVKVAYKCNNKELYQPIVGYDETITNAALKVIMAPTQWMRYGSTIAPAFILRNFLRDTMFAGISSSNGFIPFISSIKGWGMLNDKEMLAKMESMGIGQFNYVSDGQERRNNLNDVVQNGRDYNYQDCVKDMAKFVMYLSSLQTKKMKESAKNVGRYIGNFLENVSDKAEMSTRMGEFALAYENAKNGKVKQLVKDTNGKYKKVTVAPMTEAEALEYAANCARNVTLDFSRSGDFGRKINRVVPFFNANLQGGDKMVRLLTDPATSKDTALKLIKYFGTFTVLLWALQVGYDDPEKRKKLNAGMRYSNWLIPIGDGRYIKLPKPQEAGVTFASGIEALLDMWYLKEPGAATKWAREAIDTVFPEIMPAIIAPYFEWRANYNMLMGRPVVANRLLRLKNEDQYTPTTTETSKYIAKAFAGTWLDNAVGLSPLKIDNTIRGYGGTWRYQLASMAGIFSPDWDTKPNKGMLASYPLRDFVTNYNNDSEYVTEYYAFTNNLDREVKSDEGKNQKLDEKTTIGVIRQGYGATISKNNAKIHCLYENKDYEEKNNKGKVTKIYRYTKLNADEKEAEIKKLTLEIQKTAKECLEKYNPEYGGSLVKNGTTKKAGRKSSKSVF